MPASLSRIIHHSQYSYDLVFAPVVCTTAPATDDVVTGFTLDGVIICTLVDVIEDCGVL